MWIVNGHNHTANFSIMSQYSPESSTYSRTRRDEKTILQLIRCPVCHKLPTPPVYGCLNGHIICENCKEKVPHCSVCRADKFDVRNIIVEEILKGKHLLCPFCEQVELNGEEMKKHVNECTRRPIECNCKTGRPCIAEMVPRDSYLRHMKHNHGLEKAKDKQLIIKLEMAAGFAPKSFSAFGKDYLLNSARAETKFFTWIEYLGDTAPRVHAEIRLYYPPPHDPRRTVPAREELNSKMGISPLSAGVTPEQVLKSGHCLEVKTDGNNNENLPPYVWPGIELQRGSVPAWGYYIKMWKPPKETIRTVRKRSHCASQIAGVPNPQGVQVLGYQAVPADQAYYDDEDERLYEQEQLAIYAALRAAALPQAQAAQANNFDQQLPNNAHTNSAPAPTPNTANTNSASDPTPNAGQSNPSDGPLTKRSREAIVMDDLGSSDSDQDPGSDEFVASDASDDPDAPGGILYA